MAGREQSFDNHARIVPLYHFVASLILLTNAFSSAWRLYQVQDWDRSLAFAVAIALLILYYYARQFVVTLQDRVIRLEMRVRLNDVLPSELLARANQLTVRQLIALRFAGDAELPALVGKVLDERIDDAKAIKKLITNWQADHLRV